MFKKRPREKIKKKSHKKGHAFAKAFAAAKLCKPARKLEWHEDDYIPMVFWRNGRPKPKRYQP